MIEHLLRHHQGLGGVSAAGERAGLSGPHASPGASPHLLKACGAVHMGAGRGAEGQEGHSAVPVSPTAPGLDRWQGEEHPCPAVHAAHCSVGWQPLDARGHGRLGDPRAGEEAVPPGCAGGPPGQGECQAGVWYGRGSQRQAPGHLTCWSIGQGAAIRAVCQDDLHGAERCLGRV